MIKHWSLRSTWRRTLIAFAVLLSLLEPALASPPPQGWYQVNHDGFTPTLGASSWGTALLTLDGKLWALNSSGLFRQDGPIAKSWTSIQPPAPPKGPGTTPSTLGVLGDRLYAWDQGNLWWLAKGQDPAGANWTKVASKGLPGGVSPVPLALFGNQLYAVHYPAVGGFEIWRGGAAGAVTTTWQKVATNAFGDPANNQSVDIVTEFNGQIYVGTGTLKSVFGDPQGKDSGGVEIWTSKTGDPGTWTQVNADGFGTSIPYPGDPSKKLFTNHVVGAAAAHGGHLYVATNSHWGAEMWRYDGTGKAGWKNVTPPWAGPSPLLAPLSLRFHALETFNGQLYAAEGFPGANLAKFDGTTWTIVIAGPTPFDPNNHGLTSLAVLGNRLYLSAGWPAGPRGDQIWAFPFKTPVADVKVNGQDGPVTLKPSTPVKITVDLGAGELAGQKADWYLTGWAPWGIYSIVWGKGWVPGVVPFLAYPLFDLAALPVFGDPLPAGSYIIAFGVDDRPNGKLDGTVWWDYAAITSAP